MPASTRPRQPLISWLNAMGTASCRWVRPLLTMPVFFSSSSLKVWASSRAAGMSRRLTARTAAMCMAVGKVSLEDWERLTESLGWMGLSSATPCSSASRLAWLTIGLARLAIWFSRRAMTSLRFMFVCVPEPVCQTLRGNSRSCAPERISSQAASMALASAAGRQPSSALAWAAAFFRMANARMMPPGMVSVPILKFSRERCVCAPQSAAAGTRTSPMESCSIRKPSASPVSPHMCTIPLSLVPWLRHPVALGPLRPLGPLRSKHSALSACPWAAQAASVARKPQRLGSGNGSKAISYL